MLNYDDKIYDAFIESINRAKAMLIIQESMDTFYGYVNGEKDFFEYLGEKYPNSRPMLDIIFNMVSLVKTTSLMEEKNLEEMGKQTEVAFSGFDERDFIRMFKPLISFLESLETISEDPLNKEAIVTSVTAFEAYLKDRLIDLVSNNKDIEKRFTDELKKGLTYDKVKEYNRDWGNILGYVVSENVGSFFNVNDVEKTYKRVLGKVGDDNYSLYKSDNQKKLLRNYIELRHIIVHNSGIVDHKFKKITNSKYKTGELFEIKKKYVETMIGVMENIVNNIEDELDGVRHGQENGK